MANLNFVSQSNSDHTITGDGSLMSPLNGYRYSYGGSQTINYSAGVSGTIYFDFTLQDMMSSGAMAYVTVNGSYLGGATLYSPGTSLSGTSTINSGDTLVIYFDPGSDTSHMAYLIVNSIYIVSTGTTTTTTTVAPIIIKPKRSYTLNNTPTLSASELAINAASPAKIWIGSEDGMSNVLVGSMSLADMTGIAAVSTNLAGGNNTTLLGSVPYQSANNTTSLVTPNTTGTKKFLRQTGTGSNGAAPQWDTVLSSDVGLGSVENTALSTWAGSNNITTVGAVTTRTLTVTPVAGTGTQSPSVTVTAPAHTALTASTEFNDLNINLARTAQFATGALTTQRAVRIQAPTYSFVAASTITTAATLSIDSAPVAGTNATITNPIALRVTPGFSAGVGIVIQNFSNSHTGALLRAQTSSGTALFTVAGNGAVTITSFPPSGTGGTASTSLTVTGPAFFQVAASEVTDILFNLNRTFSFVAGTIDTQRSIRVIPPTLSFASASTINTAITMEIASAPIAGTNATITKSYALRVLSGNATSVGIVIQSASSQTQDLFQIKNPNDTLNLLSVNNNGSLVLSPYGTSTGQTNEIRFLELAANGTTYVGFKAGDNIASNVIWTLPTTDGANGGVMITNGSGTLSWSTAPSAASSIFLANNFGGL